MDIRTGVQNVWLNIPYWYNEFASWAYDNRVLLDVIVVLTVLGSLILLSNRRARLRRKFHRLVWGVRMKSKDIIEYHIRRFEDALTNEAMTMVEEGVMTEGQEADWYTFFHQAYKFNGFRKPPKGMTQIKNGIAVRLKLGFLGYGMPKKKSNGTVAQVVVDKSYKPQGSGASTLAKSKYVT